MTLRTPLRLLLIEDCRADAELCVHELEAGGFDVRWDVADTEHQASAALAAHSYDLVLLDFGLPRWSGSAALQMLRRVVPHLPIILVTGSMGDEMAVDCIHAGADDYVLKENLLRLAPAVRRALESQALRREREASLAERERLLAELQERVKELTCLFEVSKVLARHGDLDGILDEVAALLPSAMGFPESAQARIRYDEKNHGSSTFNCAAFLRADLVTGDKLCGSVEVCYPHPARDCFVEEERKVVHTVARTLSEALERHHAYAELERRVAERTAELAQVNEELAAARAEWETIFNCMSDAVTYHDPEYRILRSNRAFEKMFPGVASDQRCCFEVFHGSAGPVAGCPMAKTLTSGQTETAEIFEPTIGRYLQIRTDPVTNGRGTIVRVVHSVSDITQRKRDQELQERLAAILQATTGLVLTADSGGAIVYLNRAGHRLLGFPEGAGSLRVEDFYPSWQDNLARRETERNGAWVQETTLRRADGSEFPVLLVTVIHRREQAAGSFFSLVAHDISQRKEIERLKDDLVSTVSHELRTPLASMLGFTELLLERDYPAEKRREYLGIVHAETQRLCELINNFLDLQRIEAGRQAYNLEPCDLAPLLRVSAVVFESRGERHTFQVDVPERLPPVLIDVARLRQVVGNLFSNAIKYSPGGGAVRIRACLEDHNSVVFSVTDEGIGIPPEEMPRLFTRFFRGEKAAQRGIRGTGLGLALCREIVLSLGGQIWAESPPAGGARFCVRLPLAPAVSQEQDLARKPAAALAG